jgi:hypothetical protein
MVLRDFTNISTIYVPKMSWDGKYAPFIGRDKILEEQAC